MRQAWRPGPDNRSARFSTGLVVAVLLHSLLLGGGLIWEWLRPKPPEPQPDPIAVELVEEPAPPEQPQEQAQEDKPEPPPQPEQQAAQEPPPPEEKVELPPAVPLDLEPAYDAPKAASNEQELTIGDKAAGDMAASALEPQPPAPEPEPPQETLKSEAQPAPQDAPPDEPLPPDPDGLPAFAQPTPVEKPETDKTDADKPEPPDPKRFAFFAPVPKMEFESGPKQSQSASGNATDTYTTRLYGMIVPLVRIPPGLPPASRRRPLQIEFVVDARGRLAGAAVVRSSGVPALDIAVLYAIRQAAPYPPTPHGKPLPLVLDYEPP